MVTYLEESFESDNKLSSREDKRLQELLELPEASTDEEPEVASCLWRELCFGVKKRSALKCKLVFCSALT